MCVCVCMFVCAAHRPAAARRCGLAFGSLRRAVHQVCAGYLLLVCVALVRVLSKRGRYSSCAVLPVSGCVCLAGAGWHVHSELMLLLPCLCVPACPCGLAAWLPQLLEAMVCVRTCVGFCGCGMTTLLHDCSDPLLLLPPRLAGCHEEQRSVAPMAGLPSLMGSICLLLHGGAAVRGAAAALAAAAAVTWMQPSLVKLLLCKPELAG